MNNKLMSAVNTKLAPVNALGEVLRKQSAVIPDMDIEDNVPQPTGESQQADAKVEVVKPDGSPDMASEPTTDSSPKQAPAPSDEQKSVSLDTPKTPANEVTKFMTDEIENMLAQQVGNEMSAFYDYNAARAWFNGEGLYGFEAWAKKQTCDEMAHMQKVLDYLVEAGCNPALPGIEGIDVAFASVEAAVDAVFKREKAVTENWRSIAKKAMQDYDAATTDLAQWFVKEQMEEEDNVKSIKQRLALGNILVLDSQLLEQYGG